MGEIAEALKRAHEESVQSSDVAPPSGGEIAEALRRAEAEREQPQPEAPAAAEQSAPPSSELQPALGVTTDYAKDHLDHHRHLALRVRTELERAGRKTLVVVSGLRDEGKTTVASNLAMAMASITSDRNVALVDLDLRSPSIARQMKIPLLTGIEEVLQGSQTLERVCLPIDQPQLDLYPSKTPHRAAHELLVGAAFDDMMQRLERRYSTVIIDTPPSLFVPDSSLILQRGAACVAVASAGITRARNFKKMLEQLPAEQMIGKILNRAAVRGHDSDYYYYYGEEEDED